MTRLTPAPSVSPPRSRANGERGAALLEVALTLPLLLLVCMGIFEFGRAFQTWQVLTNAAREGARIAVLPAMGSAEVESRVRNFMEAGRLANSATATITVNSAARVVIGAGTASASEVTVAYPFDFMVLNPIARLVVADSSLGGAPVTLTASSLMRNESPF